MEFDNDEMKRYCNLLCDFFEMNEIPPEKAFLLMLAMVVKISKKTGSSKKLFLKSAGNFYDANE